MSKLPRRPAGPKYHFDDEVALKYYRLQKISEGAIKLEAGEGGEVPGPTAVGTGRGKPVQVELSRLIDQINERFGTSFTAADELFFSQLREQALTDAELRQAAMANTIDAFRFVFEKSLEALLIDRMEQNEDIVARILISHIGHITRDELRRYLDTTEAANGFGNRFLWVCVQRSKCLPEGGAIQTVDFGEIHRRLGRALAFARTPREGSSRPISSACSTRRRRGRCT